MASQPPPSRTIVPRQQPETLRLRALTPSFTVNDLQRSLAFYVEGLGFTVKERWEREGELRGVMLVAGRCELALGQDDGFRLYAETSQDPDALAERLRARGITFEGPYDASWGARALDVTDPDGFQVTLTREPE